MPGVWLWARPHRKAAERADVSTVRWHQQYPAGSILAEHANIATNPLKTPLQGVGGHKKVIAFAHFASGLVHHIAGLDDALDFHLFAGEASKAGKGFY